MNALRDSQLQMLWTARIDYSAGSRVEPHQHNDYDQLLVVLSGQGQVLIGERTFTVEEGSAYLLLRDVAHSFHFTGQRSRWILNFGYRTTGL